MKKFIAPFLGLFIIAAPALALADAPTSAQTQIMQLTAVVAALEAQEAALSSGQALACAALFSQSSVRVGQSVALAWGSVGALDPATASSTKPMWSPNGVSEISLQQPGTWTYSFTFYAGNGATATCTAKVIVVK